MKAAILIGGQGTRLRPFTLDTPKPLLPVLNRPFLEYQFRVLRSHGVRDIALCTSYRAENFRRAFGDGRRLGVRLKYVRETIPLGTGGAAKNAEKLLGGGTALILNGDVLNAFDVRAFLRFHRERRAARRTPTHDTHQRGTAGTNYPSGHLVRNATGADHPPPNHCGLLGESDARR